MSSRATFGLKSAASCKRLFTIDGNVQSTPRASATETFERTILAIVDNQNSHRATLSRRGSNRGLAHRDRSSS